MLVFSLSLSLFTIGLSHLIGTNELLACFFTGTALNWTDKIRAEDIHSHFSEGVELFFDTSIFLLIGTLLPFEIWKESSVLSLGGLIAAGLLTMIFRRIPAVVLLYKWIPRIHTLNEALFVGVSRLFSIDSREF
jgi:sodium/hydrogen antiporter